MSTRHNVIYKRRYINGLEVDEFTPIDVESKRLVIVMHGYTMNKEDGAWYHCMQYAVRGIKAVAIDAFNHGSRQTMPRVTDSYKNEMEYFYHVIETTAWDIKKLYEMHYQDEYPDLNLSGESMGGMLTFMIGCICENVSAIVSVVGSPSLIRYGYQDMIDNGCTQDDINGMLDHLYRFDAMSHLDIFQDMPIYCINGTKDKVVPKEYAQAFKQKIEEIYQSNTIKYVEADADHWIPFQYLPDMFDWANKMFK